MKHKKEKKFKIKTKRLVLYPLSDSEIQNLIDNFKSSGDDEMAEAYSEMLAGCVRNPDVRQWYAPWAMELKENKARIGDVGFKGPPSDGSVEIGYGIHKEYEGRGLTSDAAEAMVNWAFENEEVLFVEAETDAENAPSLRILEKLGFEKYGLGEEGPRFVKAKPGGSYLSIGISLGLCLGMSVGIGAFDNMTLGMCIGIAIGAVVGASKDKKEKAKIAERKKAKYGLEEKSEKQ